MQRKTVSSVAKLLLLVALAFYAGFSFSRLHDLFAYKFPERGSHLSAQSAFSHQMQEAPSGPKPVLLSSDSLVQLRKSMERKVFGGPRPTALPDARALDTARFVTDYIGKDSFTKYYKGLFAERHIEVTEISGIFPELHGYVWRALLLQGGAASNQKLFIYHQGHDGNPFAFRQPNNIIAQMLRLGHDVVVLSMPGYGWNTFEQVRIKTWDGWGQLPALLPDNHAPLAMADTGSGHFIKFFVSPVLASIDLALSRNSYRQITMLGHSGGGWTATLSAALDFRIDASIAYAGTLPFFARSQATEVGDAEQFDTAFYRDFPYTTLYELASWGVDRKRIHYQLYNKDDDCCFAGASAAKFMRYLEARPSSPDRDLRLAVVNNTGHHMLANAVFEIIDELEAATTSRLEALRRR